MGHYTARAWEADSGGEVGTEQMLERKRVKSDGREAAERRTTNGHLEGLCTRLENPDRKYGPFCKKRHWFCGENKGRQLTCHPLGVLCSYKGTASSREVDVCLGNIGQPGHSSVRLASLSILPLKLLTEIQFLRSVIITSCLHRKMS